MHTMLDEDELRLPAGGSFDVVTRLHRMFKDKIRTHERHYKAYQVVYYVAGGMAVLLSVIVSSLDGCAESDIVPTLALTVACLTTALNFFGVEGRLQRHNTCAKQYVSLCLGIERFSLSRVKTTAQVLKLEESLLDKYKLIQAAEPDTSGCLTKKAEETPLRLEVVEEPFPDPREPLVRK